MINVYVVTLFCLGAQQGGNSKGKGANGASGRDNSKISMLTGQTISESNVLDFMSAIELRAVDIISEYLLSSDQNNGAHKYLTLGPTTPMRQSRLHIDINEASLFDDPDETIQVPNSPIIVRESFNNDSGFGGVNVDSDSKPVDLHAFKERLWKRKTTSVVPVSTLNSPNSMNRQFPNFGSTGGSNTGNNRHSFVSNSHK